jgi:hypothetical protein
VPGSSLKILNLDCRRESSITEKYSRKQLKMIGFIAVRLVG